MTTYTKSTDFASKDALLTGNPSKVVKGVEINTEFDNIAAADATSLKSGGSLGTPSAGVLTNATGLPISTGVAGLGTGVATFLATPSSANLASALTDETGSGAVVFATSPTLVTPALGTPSALVGTNITGTASGFTAGSTNALKSASTTVDVSAATAPSSGQVLTATGGTAATWQTPSSGIGLGLNTFTAAQRGAISVLTDGATVTPDFSLANNYNLTIGGNRTLDVPTNIGQGQQGLINVWQDPTGSRTLAYAWTYSWAGGTAGTLSTAGCTRDMLAYSVDYYSSGAFTVTIATPGVFTKSTHGYISGQKCQLSTTGALPTGLTAATTYFIRVIDANTFYLCTTLANVAAGTYIATTGSQSGTHTIVCASIALSLSKAVS